MLAHVADLFTAQKIDSYEDAINDHRKIFAVQEEFNKFFPDLRAEFLGKPSKVGNPPSEKLMKHPKLWETVAQYIPAGKLENFFVTISSLDHVPTPEEVTKIFAENEMQVVGPTLSAEDLSK